MCNYVKNKCGNGDGIFYMLMGILDIGLKILLGGGNFV